MEELEHIGVGQAANDNTGDPLRDGMVKVNANFTKIQSGVDAVELTATTAKAQADSAKVIADGAVPKAQKGVAGGVAPLDAVGKVPASHLDDFIVSDEKGVAGGVAPLDAQGKVPAANLPAAEDSIPLSQKGQANGVATLGPTGSIPKEQLPPIDTIPTGFVAWCAKRSAIWAGWIPADGQTVSRATFPDVAQAVVSGVVPVVSEAEWLADPLKRGAYTLGDGSTTIRVPDYNGKSSGSIGRLFLGGDGALSAGGNGVIQRDSMQQVAGQVQFHGSGAATVLAGADGVFMGVAQRSSYGLTTFTSGAVSYDFVDFNLARVARTSTETRPLNVGGVWVIRAFGQVVNPGSVDVAQLASDYAALSAAFQSVQSRAFGVSQSLQDLITSRQLAVTYINSTGRPIAVYAQCATSNPSGGYAIFYVGDVPVSLVHYPAATPNLAVSVVVPPGSTYKFDAGNAALASWREYR